MQSQMSIVSLLKPDTLDHGRTVCISPNSKIVAISTTEEHSPGHIEGVVYVYELRNELWTKIGELAPRLNRHSASPVKKDNEGFGQSIALSHDGSTIVVGSPTWNKDDGCIYVFRLYKNEYILDTLIPANIRLRKFGSSVSISHDGLTIAVGAPYSKGKAISPGAVHIYRSIVKEGSNSLDGRVWIYSATIVDMEEIHNVRFGYAISLSGNGKVLAIGAPDNDTYNISRSGIVHTYAYTSVKEKTMWVYTGHVASHLDEELTNRAMFGHSVATNYDGTKLIVGAPYTISPKDPTKTSKGMVYIYSRETETLNDNSWSFESSQYPITETQYDSFGMDVTMSDSGNIVCVLGSRRYIKDKSNSDVYVNTAYIYKKSENGWIRNGERTMLESDKRDVSFSKLTMSVDGNVLIAGGMSELSKGVPLTSHVVLRDLF